MLAANRRGVIDLPWRAVRQVHGADVVVADSLEGADAVDADAIVVTVPGLAASVYTADCAPVVLVAPDAVAVAHAGWRGLVAGVVQASVAALRAHSSGGMITAHIGPCIRAACYEFGADDLARAEDRLGPTVRATTSWGTPAFDMTAALAVVLAEADVESVHDTGVCTACSPVHPSHRARRDVARLAAVAWMDDARPGDGNGDVDGPSNEPTGVGH